VRVIGVRVAAHQADGADLAMDEDLVEGLDGSAIQLFMYGWAAQGGAAQ
jgi:hypothetical protein